MSATQLSRAPEVESVLIVNDTPEQLSMMAGLFQKAGFLVITAENGLRALELARQHQPNLIISDVCMPSISGLDFCRSIRNDQKLRSVPVLLVSALLMDSSSLVEGLRAGADDYLEIPFDSTRLIAKATRLLERQRFDARYRDLVEQASEVIFTQDLSGRLTSINPAGARFAGREPGDLIGESFSSVFGLLGLHSSNGATYFSDPKTGNEFKHQFTAKSPSGKDQWLDLTMSPLQDRSNQIVGLRGVIRDITERKQVELALRDSEERYRLLFESTPQPMLVYEEDTHKFLTVNEAATLTYGYTRDEFLSLTIDAISVPSENAAVKFPCGIAGIWEHQTKTKRTICVEVTSHPLVFDGQHSRLVIVNDVTERKRMDEASQRMQASLRQSAVEWTQTFDAIDFPVLIVDLAGRIKRSNQAAEHLLNGRTLTSKFLTDLGELQPWKKAVELIAKVTEPTLVQEEVGDEATGKTWSIALFPLSETKSGPDRIILMAQDITKRTELEASLRQSKIMSILGTVVAGVAHEVRNPLFALSSILDALETRFSERTEYQKYTNILRSEIERLTVLMEDLLEYGKPFMGELYPESLKKMISGSMRSCHPAAELAQVTIVNHVDDALPQIMVDKRRLSSVLINLMENAIQHSSPDSIVTVDAHKTFESGQLWIDCLIKDFGPGIQEEDLSKIFEPFFSKRRGGTGLGLAIAQKTMQDLGGNLFAYNHSRGGACLTARFPIPFEVSA